MADEFAGESMILEEDIDENYEPTQEGKELYLSHIF
jgi:hypothetical protein